MPDGSPCIGQWSGRAFPQVYSFPILKTPSNLIGGQIIPKPQDIMRIA